MQNVDDECPLIVCKVRRHNIDRPRAHVWFAPYGGTRGGGGGCCDIAYRLGLFCTIGVYRL